MRNRLIVNNCYCYCSCSVLLQLLCYMARNLCEEKIVPIGCVHEYFYDCTEVMAMFTLMLKINFTNIKVRGNDETLSTKIFRYGILLCRIFNALLTKYDVHTSLIFNMDNNK